MKWKFLARVYKDYKKVETKDLPMGSELKRLSGCREISSVVKMAGEHKRILKDGEILVPKSLSDKIKSKLHVTHSSDGMMILNTKHHIFLPQIKLDLKAYYEKCHKCLEHKSTELSYENLHMRFEPKLQVQADFCEYGRENFMLIVCEISGFLKVTKQGPRVLKRQSKLCVNGGLLMADHIGAKLMGA